jgi:pimeloyl-ACP methyl ester carboxylesterase
MSSHCLKRKPIQSVHLFSKDVGIETAIQDVLNVIKYNDLENFVLVGHSFAGKVAAAAADRIPERVKMVLYLDAPRPDKGVREPQSGGTPPFEPKNGEWKIPLTDEILTEIGKDVQRKDREWLLSKATPWP